MNNNPLICPVHGSSPLARPALLLTLMLGLLLAMPAAAGVTRDGVTLENTADAQGRELVLYGHGTARYARIFRVYVAGLYGPADVAATDLLKQDVPRRLEIEYLRDVKASDIMEATRVVLEDQLDEQQLEQVRGAFQRFGALYQDVTQGDRYVFEYIPGEGSNLYFNGKLMGNEPGEAFALAYLGIWLAEPPLSESMRQDLLALQKEKQARTRQAEVRKPVR